MQRRPQILVLHAHIQPFLIAGIKKLAEEHRAEVLVVCWPKSDTSPTNTIENTSIRFLTKRADNVAEVHTCVREFNADIVYTVGWMDKTYLAWTQEHKKKGKKTLLAMDTQWEGRLKQRLNCVLAPLFLRRVFTHAWVPGIKQYEYANRLGFREDEILSNLYAPDTDLFNKYYLSTLPKKTLGYPKNFLYVGRLVSHKLENLLRAFSGLSDVELNGWKLIVVGNGPFVIAPFKKNPNILFRPFLQQNEQEDIVSDAGVFCLTSSIEPWGMVVQEFAAAGLPLLVSKQCGAQHSMVNEGSNGFLCDGNDVEDIKKQLKLLAKLEPEQLLEMGAKSNHIGTVNNSATWAATLMSVF